MLSSAVKRQHAALASDKQNNVGSLILRCRAIRHGPMLEQALLPGRENLCGIGGSVWDCREHPPFPGWVLLIRRAPRDAAHRIRRRF